MRIRHYQPAEPNERFARDAFASLTGVVVPWKINDRKIGDAKLISAVVDPGGTGVTWEFEIVPLPEYEEQAAAALYMVERGGGITGRVTPMSFSFTVEPDVPDRWWQP